VAKTVVAGLTVAAVLALAQARVNRSDANTPARAVGALRAISSAQHSYASTNGGYARSLRALTAPCPGRPSAFLSPDVGNDPTVTGGYEIRLRATAPVADGRRDCNGKPMASGYYATAVPVRPSRGLTDAFAVDEHQAIWYDVTGVAPTPPFRAAGTVQQLR
jgi:hypothetical protein